MHKSCQSRQKIYAVFSRIGLSYEVVEHNNIEQKLNGSISTPATSIFQYSWPVLPHDKYVDVPTDKASNNIVFLYVKHLHMIEK